MMRRTKPVVSYNSLLLPSLPYPKESTCSLCLYIHRHVHQLCHMFPHWASAIFVCYAGCTKYITGNATCGTIILEQ